MFSLSVMSGHEVKNGDLSLTIKSVVDVIIKLILHLTVSLDSFHFHKP